MNLMDRSGSSINKEKFTMVRLEEDSCMGLESSLVPMGLCLPVSSRIIVRMGMVFCICPKKGRLSMAISMLRKSMRWLLNMETLCSPR